MATRSPRVRRDDLAAGVERDAAAVVDELVPHPQDPLLRLAEVVGVEDPVHALLEVDEDEPVVGPARRLQVGGVDDRELGLEVLGVVDGEPELLLHAGDVRVRGLDVEAHGDAELGLGAEPAVEEDHLLARRCRRPACRPTPGPARVETGAGDAGIGVVGDDERRGLRARQDLGLDVDVFVLRPAGRRHLRGELLKLVGGGIADDGAACGSWNAILAMSEVPIGSDCPTTRARARARRTLTGPARNPVL